MEYVDVFDNKRRKINKTNIRYKDSDNEYMQAMHLWVINDKGEFLIQKRSEIKKTYPSMWSVTGGGSQKDENTLDTCVRECKEELGINIDINNLEFILSIKRKNLFLDVYLLKQSFDIKELVLQQEEVSEAKWVSIEELKRMIDNKLLASNVVAYFDLFIKCMNKEI